VNAAISCLRHGVIRKDQHYRSGGQVFHSTTIPTDPCAYLTLAPLVLRRQPLFAIALLASGQASTITGRWPPVVMEASCIEALTMDPRITHDTGNPSRDPDYRHPGDTVSRPLNLSQWCWPYSFPLHVSALHSPAPACGMEREEGWSDDRGLGDAL